MINGDIEQPDDLSNDSWLVMTSWSTQHQVTNQRDPCADVAIQLVIIQVAEGVILLAGIQEGIDDFLIFLKGQLGPADLTHQLPKAAHHFGCH